MNAYNNLGHGQCGSPPTPAANHLGIRDRHDWPEYVCFKRVHAARIVSVSIPEQIITVEPEDQPPMAIRVTQEWLERNCPHVGGFLVEYSDGYLSFSPAVPFYEGYAKVQIVLPPVSLGYGNQGGNPDPVYRGGK